MTSSKVRVLVVDDSVVIRRMLSEIIESDSRFELAGFAANGQIALTMLERVAPDIVTLDIEMPVLDGLATLKEIRTRHRRLPVIMFSTLTERGAEATIEALSLGASDYVTKPANVGSFSAARQQILDVLIPKMKSLCGIVELPAARTLPPPQPKKPPLAPTPAAVRIVTIGCSTGGPNALAELLRGLPSSFPVPIVIAQHMPPVFTKFLAQRLKNHCALPVHEAEQGDVIRPGQVWVAPGDYHMVLARESNQVRIVLNRDAPENSCRPSVDVLFRSVAAVYPSSAVLAVVLTGMGQDGLRGCEVLASGGASIVVQDEATSIVWGMPGAVARAGLATSVVSLPHMAGEIMRRVQWLSGGAVAFAERMAAGR